MARRKRQKRRARYSSPAVRSQKAGDAYQEVVAQVARSLQQGAKVVVGSWIDGPDGRRDLDVVVWPVQAGAMPLVVIECKDWTRPIGIGFIDALESKRRDLGAVVAMICSNSGFTADALRKAARVGITPLAALVEGDNRIRVVVRQQIYTRVIEFTHHRPLFRHQELSPAVRASLAELGTSEFTYGGKSMEAWVSGLLLKISAPATRSRSFLARITFTHPLTVKVRGIDLFVTAIDVQAAFKVQWMTQVAEIGASQGMYNYLRQVVVMGPGPNQFHLKNVNSETWGTPIDITEVPPQLLVPLEQRSGPPAGTEMQLAMLKNMPQSDPKDAPDLQPFIESEQIIDEDQPSGH